jgi:hypothetical protein
VNEENAASRKCSADHPHKVGAPGLGHMGIELELMDLHRVCMG